MAGLGAPTLEGQPSSAPASGTTTPVADNEPHRRSDSAPVVSSSRRFGAGFHSATLPTKVHQILPSLTLPFLSSEEKAPSIPANSIAALSHRENTPLHALRDTLVSNVAGVHLRKPNEAHAFADLAGHVVLLGGYRGSVLRDAKTHRRLWAPVKTALRLRTADLEMPLTDEAELRSTETVVAEKMLTTVGGFVQMGKNLKEKLVSLEKEGKITFKSFGYDWRRNLDLSSAELLHHVESIYRSTGQGSTVICHSMGGLVGLHALARAADPMVFSRMLFAGTPFLGTANALGPLRHGDALGWNAAICSPKAVFSMRSTFYFLPDTGSVVFEREDGSPVETDFFSLQDWSHFGFSPVTLHLQNPASAAREIALRDAETASFVDESMPAAEEPASEEYGNVEEPGSIPIAPRMSSSSRPTSTISPKIPQLALLDLDKTASPSDDALIADYLARTLKRVQKFRREIVDSYDDGKAERYPPLGLLVSATTPTVRGALVSSEADVIAGDFSRLLYGHGDGIVLHSAAVNLPGRWGNHVQVIENTSFGHVSLLSDLHAVRRALAKLT